MKRRDDRKCQVPECRASRHVDVHHIVPRHLGGGHEAENLILLCSGHHQALHDGALTITGPAPDIRVTWTNTRSAMPHVGHAAPRHDPATNLAPRAPSTASHVGHASKYERVVMKTEAIQALTQLGFPKSTARGWVEAVLETTRSELTLEQLLREALQRSRSL